MNGIARPRFIDLTGDVFGRVTVLSYAGKTAGRASLWNCVCECGTSWVANGSSLRGGETRSCGCLQREIAKAAGDRTRTHSLSRTPIYAVWRGMMARCTNKRSDSYKHYGGRGIRVCDRWLSFENFFSDMGHPPHGMTIERKDNDCDYKPENCRWATVKDQNRNKRTTRLLTLNGRTQCLADWAKELNRPGPTIWSRLSRGWTVERALA